MNNTFVKSPNIGLTNLFYLSYLILDNSHVSCMTQEIKSFKNKISMYRYPCTTNVSFYIKNDNSVIVGGVPAKFKSVCKYGCSESTRCEPWSDEPYYVLSLVSNTRSIVVCKQKLLRYVVRDVDRFLSSPHSFIRGIDSVTLSVEPYLRNTGVLGYIEYF